MITLYGYCNTRSLRAAWMLEELALDYHYTSINLLIGEGRSASFLSLNPAGKLPVLKDDELVITESAAIITYLGDKYGDGKLVPEAGSVLRARYDQWCYFAMTELEQPLWTMAKHQFALPPQQRIAEAIPTAQWEYQKALAYFSQGLASNAYILGEQFSGADILLCQTLQWATAFEQGMEADNLQSYFNRVSQRPALKRAIDRERTAAEMSNS